MQVRGIGTHWLQRQPFHNRVAVREECELEG